VGAHLIISKGKVFEMLTRRDAENDKRRSEEIKREIRDLLNKGKVREALEFLTKRFHSTHVFLEKLTEIEEEKVDGEMSKVLLQARLHSLIVAVEEDLANRKYI